jgi:predicted ArsR family transcriptional regulator
MEFSDFAKQLESLAVIDEPVRRKLYLYVIGRDGDVSRDEAARATRISRPLAAFHLDKLVNAGLLETTFRRLSNRTGPGAGRPSKLYRRSSASFDVTLPQRRYELAARVLAEALSETLSENRAEDRRDILGKVARDWGQRLARESAVRKHRGVPLNRAMHALQVCGFEPRRTPEDEIVLRNCPFDSLRENCTEMICGMNLALIQGLLEGLELENVDAMLAPRPGMCCVALRNRAEDESLGGDR